MKVNQYIFGTIKNSDIYKDTRFFIPISKFDSFSERSLYIKLISLGLRPKKIPRDITSTPDFDIGNGYVVECTNYHGYFQVSRIEKTQEFLKEPGFEYFTNYGYDDRKKIIPIESCKRKLSNNATIVRYIYDEWSHIEKIKNKIEEKYGQCHDYEKRIINLNFINEPFNPEILYQIIHSILIDFKDDYENLIAIMVGIKIPPHSPFLKYFIVTTKANLLPKEFKKISQIPRGNYHVVPFEIFFNFGKNSLITLRPPHTF